MKVLDWAYMPFAIIAVVVIMLVAVVVMAFGQGDRWDVGGLIGKILKRDKTQYPKVQISPRALPIGETDREGYQQVLVVPYAPPSNPFRDKGVLEVLDPVTGDTEKVRLPEGVKDHDVASVIILRPKENVPVKIEVVRAPIVATTEEDLKWLR